MVSLLSHYLLHVGNDEPKTLSYANASDCSIGADRGQDPLNAGQLGWFVHSGSAF